MTRASFPLLALLALPACGLDHHDGGSGGGSVTSAAESLEGADLAPELAAAAAVPIAEVEVAAPEAIAFAGAVGEAEAEAAEAGTLDAADADPTFRPGHDAIVRIVWGYRPARPADEWIDWSGFVAVSRGRVRVLRPLRFEGDGEEPIRPHEDVIAPQTDPRLLRFRSHTRPAADGLLLLVHRDEIRPAVLVIHTAQATRVLPFEELLAGVDAVETVTPSGHELAIRSHRLGLPGPCADVIGRAAGEYTGLGGGDGAARGRLETADGTVLGLRLRTEQVIGPYGRFAGGAFAADGTRAARLGGYWAAFRYAPGGALVGRVRAEDGEDAALLGRWADGRFRARVIDRRCDADPAAE